MAKWLGKLTYLDFVWNSVLLVLKSMHYSEIRNRLPCLNWDHISVWLSSFLDVHVFVLVNFTFWKSLGFLAALSSLSVHSLVHRRPPFLDLLLVLFVQHLYNIVFPTWSLKGFCSIKQIWKYFSSAMTFTDDCDAGKVELHYYVIKWFTSSN